MVLGLLINLPVWAFLVAYDCFVYGPHVHHIREGTFLPYGVQEISTYTTPAENQVWLTVRFGSSATFSARIDNDKQFYSTQCAWRTPHPMKLGVGDSRRAAFDYLLIPLAQRNALQVEVTFTCQYGYWFTATPSKEETLHFVLRNVTSKFDKIGLHRIIDNRPWPS